ncbi:MAG: hypothetical protein R3B93_15635 [Bacteroidia bacterium]
MGKRFTDKYPHVGGCSDFEIEYENLEELDRKMRLFMEEKIV